jgi:hypothetical protein
MKTLAIAVPGNHNEFVSQAKSFQTFWSNQPDHTVELEILSKGSQALQYTEVRSAILNFGGGLDRLAFFCHGYPRELRVGFNLQNIDKLATAIRLVSNLQVHVALYSCSCGRLPLEWPWKLTSRSWAADDVKSCFAAALTWELHLASIKPVVFAHGSRGHTTLNPYCYEFTIFDEQVIRTPLVPRTPKNTWSNWIEELKTDRRFEVPFE